MTAPAATYVVRLTATGRAAVASLLVEGPDASRIVDALFRPTRGLPLGERPENAIVLGHWQSAEQGEELVVSRRDAQRYEVHCHGGDAAPAAIIASLLAAGCQEITWRQWLERSTPDSISATAHIALAEAPTLRTAAILWDQASGALSAAVNAIAAQIADSEHTAALAGIDRLLEHSATGQHLIAPWRVALTGRPNVGKSTLINALAGYERAIVHATPGTTRDVVKLATAIDGWPVELADTAGWRDSADSLEAAGIELARVYLERADLVVLVFDASTGLTDDDLRLRAAWPAALVVWNKRDLVSSDTTVGKADDIITSAAQGEGLEQLQQAISSSLVPNPPAPSQAVPFTAEQRSALVAARRLLAGGRNREVGELLRELAR